MSEGPKAKLSVARQSARGRRSSPIWATDVGTMHRKIRAIFFCGETMCAARSCGCARTCISDLMGKMADG